MRAAVVLIAVSLQAFALAAPATAADRSVEIIDPTSNTRFSMDYDDTPIAPNGRLDGSDAVWTFQFEFNYTRYAYSVPTGIRLQNLNGRIELRDRRGLTLEGQPIRGRVRGFFDCANDQAEITLRIRRGPARGTYQVIKQPSNGTMNCT